MSDTLLHRRFSLTLSVPLLFFIALSFGCLPKQPDQVDPSDFFKLLQESGQIPQALVPEDHLALSAVVPRYRPLGIYELNGLTFALFDLPAEAKAKDDFFMAANYNLRIYSSQEIPSSLRNAIEALSPRVGFEQLGSFVYPLGACLLLSVFVTMERLFALRRGVTFPRKVEKALIKGEFPDRRWKRGSAAERIVHVGLRENASPETIRSYARLELAAMERGMFLLDVVIAGAPLIGLLGTVTGLVEVFSQMPQTGEVDKTLLSQGISLALLTTMAGLTIALPTLLANGYLQRLLDKRAAALDWLTARVVDSIDHAGVPPEVMR